MVNRSLVCLLMVMASFQVFSQDVIVLKNRAKIDAKEVAIKGNVILYQDYTGNSGYEYSVDINKVDYIQYQNGEKLQVNEIAVISKSKTNYGLNLISFHILDFAINNFTFSYERILGNGKYSLQIPVSFGYGDSGDNDLLPLPFGTDYENSFANRFSTGVSFNIYPTRQGKVRYFFGPSIQIGSGIYFPKYYNDNPDEIKTGFMGFMVNNGLMITPIEHLSMAVVGSLGARHFFKIENGKTISTLGISFNLTYRF